VARTEFISSPPNTAYVDLHQWINRHFPRTGQCEKCGGTGKTEYASIDHTYTRNRADWLELCRSCHLRVDGHTPPRPAGQPSWLAAYVHGPRSAAHKAAMAALSRQRKRDNGKFV
jgi:hypothetical protein